MLSPARDPVLERQLLLVSPRVPIIAIVIGLAAVAGCIRPYDKPEVAAADRARDEDECRRLNTVPRVSRPFVFSRGGLESYPFEGLDRHGYGLCMEGKGYAASRILDGL
jgi:hypothetical protein